MSLGPLTDEPAEPMTREDFIAAQKRLRESWAGSVTIPNRDVQRMLEEIEWLKRRLQRVEHAIEPIVTRLQAKGS